MVLQTQLLFLWGSVMSNTFILIRATKWAIPVSTLASLLFFEDFTSFLLVGIVYAFICGSFLFSQFFFGYLKETKQFKKMRLLRDFEKAAGRGIMIAAALIAGTLIGTLLYGIKNLFGPLFQ